MTDKIMAEISLPLAVFLISIVGGAFGYLLWRTDATRRKLEDRLGQVEMLMKRRWNAFKALREITIGKDLFQEELPSLMHQIQEICPHTSTIPICFTHKDGSSPSYEKQCRICGKNEKISEKEYCRQMAKDAQESADACMRERAFYLQKDRGVGED